MIMFLQDTKSDSLIKISDPEALFNPTESMVKGCRQTGEEEQPPTQFPKNQLMFPSGEALPQCWVDANYRQAL
jgi:hypothetical protein